MSDVLTEGAATAVPQADLGADAVPRSPGCVRRCQGPGRPGALPLSLSGQSRPVGLDRLCMSFSFFCLAVL